MPKAICVDCNHEFEQPAILMGILKTCDSCSDKRYKANERAEAEKRAANEARRREYVLTHYSEVAASVGLPPRLHAASMETMVRDAGNSDALEAANTLLSSSSGGILYMTGEPGTGKTWIAAAICRERIMNLQSVLFVRSIDLVNSIRSGFNSKSDPTDPYKGYPFLVIDDLGTESFTDWSVGYWYDLIDRRYNYLLPTVITSNLPLKELKNKVSARVVSRISESSMVVKLTGKDRRLTGGKS